MRPTSSICKDCTGRFPGCHPGCAAYQEERAENARRLERERINQEVLSAQIERYDAMRYSAARSPLTRFRAFVKNAAAAARR